MRNTHKTAFSQRTQPNLYSSIRHWLLLRQETALDFWPVFAFIFRQTGNLLFSIGSHFSLTSLAAAFLIATAFFVWQRVRRGRRVRVRTILRALFPKRILHSRSNEADIG
jgi:hypothetical protein